MKEPSNIVFHVEHSDRKQELQKTNVHRSLAHGRSPHGNGYKLQGPSIKCNPADKDRAQPKGTMLSIDISWIQELSASPSHALSATTDTTAERPARIQTDVNGKTPDGSLVVGIYRPER
jgi:hypothetical protein